LLVCTMRLLDKYNFKNTVSRLPLDARSCRKRKEFPTLRVTFKAYYTLIICRRQPFLLLSFRGSERVAPHNNKMSVYTKLSTNKNNPKVKKYYERTPPPKHKYSFVKISEDVTIWD